jgi:hypothetical protein
MENILIYIKHKLPFIWIIIEKINGYIFYLLFGRRLNKVVKNYLPFKLSYEIEFRLIKNKDLPDLEKYLKSEKDLDYFSPHDFSLKTLQKMQTYNAFLMMGVFDKNELAGYFFLRFFSNKKAFIGRMVRTKFRRKGLAKEMSRIMYSIVWDMKFRCLTTISSNNQAIFTLHESENNIKHLKTLSNNYHLVEIVQK